MADNDRAIGDVYTKWPRKKNTGSLNNSIHLNRQQREWAHDDFRILYDFTFYVPHSTSDDVSSMFVMFLPQLLAIYNEKCQFAHASDL